ncbi:hypothetical protein ACEQ8H_002887 [Pleosporales sp. CAS-2024a]
MAWHDEDSWLTAALSPTLSTILLTLVVAIGLPILLHGCLYRKAAAPASLPTFLLVGPSGGGKTAFATLTERRSVAQTHTSTQPLSVEALLPAPHVPASSHYRSAGDPALERARRFLVVDTPGHGKLRHYAASMLADPTSLRGIIFVVDAAALADDAGLSDAAGYLHDVLLALQKRYTGATSSKAPPGIPVLIAANKMDLFTALPANLVKHQLERAITEVRMSRAKALRDAGAALSGGEDDVDEEKEWLGEGGEGAFEFSQMQEIGTTVTVVGANVVQRQHAGSVSGWWEWIGELLLDSTIAHAKDLPVALDAPVLQLKIGKIPQPHSRTAIGRVMQKLKIKENMSVLEITFKREEKPGQWNRLESRKLRHKAAKELIRTTKVLDKMPCHVSISMGSDPGIALLILRFSNSELSKFVSSLNQDKDVWQRLEFGSRQGNTTDHTTTLKYRSKHLDLFPGTERYEKVLNSLFRQASQNVGHLTPLL